MAACFLLWSTTTWSSQVYTWRDLWHWFIVVARQSRSNSFPFALGVNDMPIVSDVFASRLSNHWLLLFHLLNSLDESLSLVASINHVRYAYWIWIHTLHQVYIWMTVNVCQLARIVDLCVYYVLVHSLVWVYCESMQVSGYHSPRCHWLIWIQQQTRVVFSFSLIED